MSRMLGILRYLKLSSDDECLPYYGTYVQFLTMSIRRAFQTCASCVFVFPLLERTLRTVHPSFSVVLLPNQVSFRSLARDCQLQVLSTGGSWDCSIFMAALRSGRQERCLVWVQGDPDQ